MFWLRPDREILPRPNTHTSEHSTLLCCYGGSQLKAWYKVYRLEPGTHGVQINYAIRSTTAA